MALGSQAVAAQHAHSLIRRAAALPERFYSLFREGLAFFAESVEGLLRFGGLDFFSDARFP